MKVKDSAYKYYLHDLIPMFKEEAEEAVKKIDNMRGSKEDIVYYEGVLTTYIQILHRMIGLAEGFQLSLKDINLDNFDPYDFYSKLKKKDVRRETT